MRIAFNPSTVAALTSPPDNKDITFDLRGRNIFARGVKFQGTDTNTWRDIKVNNISIGSNVLDLRNGSNTTLANTNGVVTINSTWRPVVDNLTSNSTTSSLSANQGRVLKALIDGKSDSDHNHDDRYVKKSGDTMLGALNFANNTWNKVGDDSYMGDCNVSGHVGIKAANTTYPGVTFFNNASTRLGNLTAYSGNIKYEAYSLQFLDNGNTSVNASTWTNPFSTYNSNAVADGQAICVWGQSSYLHNLASDTGDMSLWLKRVNAKGATLNMVLDGEYYANGNQRLAHVSEIPTSLKNPYALTISLNGTSQGPYDGSAAKNINITPGSIGAAVSNHGHDYLVVNTADDKSFNSAYHNFQVLYAGGGNGIAGRPSGVDAFGLIRLRAAFGGSGQMLLASGGSLYIRSSEDAKMTSTLAWKTILDSSNYSGILDSRYYTESEVNSLLDAKLNRQNLSYGTWNPRSYNLAADYQYNGGDLSISENSNKIFVSIDGSFWQNEGRYRVLDTSDVASLKGDLTVHQYLSATDTTWWPLIWGGSVHANTNDSTGAVYKSHDKLSWQTSSQTLYTTRLQTTDIIFSNSGTSMRGIQGTVGDNDFWRIKGGATASNSGYLEIATADDGNEPIYVRQYTGVFSTIKRTLTLLDANGFTHFPSYINIGGNENNNSSPDRVWGSNGSDSYLRSYRTSALRVANADTVDGEHASNFSYTHQTSFDFSKGKSGRIVTFDQSGTDYGWINGFASTHNNYLTSVIFNTHRTSNWYVGYIEANTSTGVTSGLTAVKQLAFLDSKVADSDKLDGIHANGLLTSVTNTNNGISITVGGTTKSISNISVNYASSAGNAKTLGGFPKNYGQAPFGTIPYIGNDGVMEIGRYIDYHYDNSGKYDFSTRLQTTGNYRNVVSLPSASGTLALISQVLTWKSQIIDMRSYSESYWHPVTVPLPYTGYNKIKVSVQLNSGDKPSWATHRDGITCNMEIWATANGWGATDSATICLNYTYKFCSQNPCGWMQLGNPSLGVVFLRGGSRYTVYTDFDATFTPHNQKYTWSSGGFSQDTGGPHTSCPGLNFNMGAIRADLIATMVQARRVCAGHDPGIDNSISCSNWFRSSGNTGWYNTTYQGGWYMSDTSWIRAHNGVGIYTSGQMKARGFHHESVDSDNYILLAGGGYKSFGGDDNNPIFLGYLNLDHGNDGTISSSFSCLGYSVPFTYTRGGNYCRINIPNTTHQVFYIKAAIASVNYSGGGMDAWVGYHRGTGAWWLHCYASGFNEVRVKGFCQANGNNDSWWGGNPLWSGNNGANKITVCIFGYVKFR